MATAQSEAVLYSFRNDYSEGAHPAILKALSQTNLVQVDGYGEDEYSMAAADLIRERIGNPEADIHFVSGGTQANLIVISSALRPHESVIAAETGHINGHETGAVEATGHKVNIADSVDGKLTAEGIRPVLKEHYFEHMVKPAMVYISNSTEVGTFYTKRELEELSSFCREKNLYLYLDGARLGSALCAEGNDLSLADLSSLVDVFYIGGTKNGALLGEAIVINNDRLKTEFRYGMKQKGAMLAKGKILSLQFLELFKEDLFFELAGHANRMASKMSEEIRGLGYGFLAPSATNQIFPIFPNVIIESLETRYGFYRWSEIDGKHSSVRLVTSWATKTEAVESFLLDLKALSTGR